MRFVMKHSQDVKPQKDIRIGVPSTRKKEVEAKADEPVKDSQPKSLDKAEKDNKDTDKKKDDDMIDENKIKMAENIISDAPQIPVKRLKKDKGLIERMESSKIILTEDNRQLLND